MPYNFSNQTPFYILVTMEIIVYYFTYIESFNKCKPILKTVKFHSLSFRNNAKNCLFQNLPNSMVTSMCVNFRRYDKGCIMLSPYSQVTYMRVICHRYGKSCIILSF